MTEDLPLEGLDTSVPHPARMHNYVLGGKDHFPPDREAAEKRLAVLPDWRTSARENRWFLGRAVRYLTAEAGVRQFLDIGPGLPAAGATHEVAQAIAPETRVAYADNDPMVIAHARALLTSTPEGACAYIHADLRDPGEGYLTGLEPLPPGPVLVSDWRRDIPGPKPLPSEINFYGAVARKP